MKILYNTNHAKPYQIPDKPYYLNENPLLPDKDGLLLPCINSDAKHLIIK
jgi:negative regulator of replication initiation